MIEGVAGPETANNSHATTALIPLLTIPSSILFAIILAFTIIGAYSVNSSAFDLRVLTLFGLLGYLFKKLDFPLAPVALTFSLGPM